MVRKQHNHKARTLRSYGSRHRREDTNTAENEYEPLRDPELDEHRRQFLGKPGSEQWNEYYAGLSSTKRRFFGESLGGKKRHTISNYGKYSGGGATWLGTTFKEEAMKGVLDFVQKENARPDVMKTANTSSGANSASTATAPKTSEKSIQEYVLEYVFDPLEKLQNPPNPSDMLDLSNNMNAINEKIEKIRSYCKNDVANFQEYMRVLELHKMVEDVVDKRTEFASKKITTDPEVKEVLQDGLIQNINKLYDKMLNKFYGAEEKLLGFIGKIEYELTIQNAMDTEYVAIQNQSASQTSPAITTPAKEETITNKLSNLGLTGKKDRYIGLDKVNSLRSSAIHLTGQLLLQFENLVITKQTTQNLGTTTQVFSVSPTINEAIYDISRLMNVASTTEDKTKILDEVQKELDAAKDNLSRIVVKNIQSGIATAVKANQLNIPNNPTKSIPEIIQDAIKAVKGQEESKKKEILYEHSVLKDASGLTLIVLQDWIEHLINYINSPASKQKIDFAKIRKVTDLYLELDGQPTSFKARNDLLITEDKNKVLFEPTIYVLHSLQYPWIRGKLTEIAKGEGDDPKKPDYKAPYTVPTAQSGTTAPKAVDFVLETMISNIQYPNNAQPPKQKKLSEQISELLGKIPGYINDGIISKEIIENAPYTPPKGTFMPLQLGWGNTQTTPTTEPDKYFKKPDESPITAEDVRIYLIPFFMQVYLRLITRTKDTYKEVKQEPNQATRETKMKAYVEMHDLIPFLIRVLRDMNMYVNPVFLDDLYYYYYVLGLDKYMPSLDWLFRFADVPEPETETPEQVGTRVTMSSYPIAPNDNNAEQIGYDYVIRTENIGNPHKHWFDHWLNLVRIRPSDKQPEMNKIQRDFLFEPIVVNDPKYASENIPAFLTSVPTPNPDANANGKSAKKGGGNSLEPPPSSEELDQPTIPTPLTAEYHYLPDSILHKHLEDCVHLGDHLPETPYTIYIALFSLDWSCHFDQTRGPTPFLKFLAEKPTIAGEPVAFAQMEYSCAGDTEENERRFKCELYDRVLSVLKLTIRHQEESTAESEGGDDLSAKCDKMASTLDSFYRGLVSETLDGGKTVVLALFDYDAIDKLVYTAQNATPEAMFERQESESLYPITDDNVGSALQWIIVDELVFNQKVGNIPVHPDISLIFSKHYHLWNIENKYHAYIEFPFVGYNLEEQEGSAESTTPKFQSVTLSPADDAEGGKMRTESLLATESVDHTAFSAAVELDNYGKEEEYDSRYCFTQIPISSEKTESMGKKRYAMFVWKTRYIVEGNVPEIDPNQSAEILDKIAIEKQEFPTIYFTMNLSQDTPTDVWGIKQNNQFSAL